MPDLWVERPRVYPHRCAVSGRSKVEDGPFYEFPLEYQTEDDGPTHRLYISAKYLLAPFSKPGAPVAVCTEGEALEANARADAAEAEVARLEAELLTAEQELEQAADTFARSRARRTPAKTPRRKPAPE